jgi:hypothetical protein
MKARKRIRIDQLKPGMYVVGMDQPWYKTPFLLHHFAVKSKDTVIELVRCGVQEVTIDPEKGTDVADDEKTGTSPQSPHAASTGNATGSPGASADQSAAESVVRRTDQVVYREAEAAIERVFENLNNGELPSAACCTTRPPS